jgi:DnaJ-class molecular chaperone
LQTKLTAKDLFMHKVYSPSVLLSPKITCPKCNWQGKGTDVKQEELILTDAIELYCPTCNGYMGFISNSEDGE